MLYYSLLVHLGAGWHAEVAVAPCLAGWCSTPSSAAAAVGDRVTARRTVGLRRAVVDPFCAFVLLFATLAAAFCPRVLGIGGGSSDASSLRLHAVR